MVPESLGLIPWNDPVYLIIHKRGTNKNEVSRTELVHLSEAQSYLYPSMHEASQGPVQT